MCNPCHRSVTETGHTDCFFHITQMESIAIVKRQSNRQSYRIWPIKCVYFLEGFPSGAFIWDRHLFEHRCLLCFYCTSGIQQRLLHINIRMCVHGLHKHVWPRHIFGTWGLFLIFKQSTRRIFDQRRLFGPGQIDKCLKLNLRQHNEQTENQRCEWKVSNTK